MSSQSKRLIDGVTFTANMKQSKEDAFDAGAYTSLAIQCRVLKAGTAGNVVLEHAAVNDEGAFQALTGATFSATSSSPQFVYVTGFLRYVRAAGDGAVAGSPVVLIDVIAKE